MASTVGNRRQQGGGVGGHRCRKHFQLPFAVEFAQVGCLADGKMNRLFFEQAA